MLVYGELPRVHCVGAGCHPFRGIPTVVEKGEGHMVRVCKVLLIIGVTRLLGVVGIY